MEKCSLITYYKATGAFQGKGTAAQRPATRVLVMVSIAVRRHHDQDNAYLKNKKNKKVFNWGLAYIFRVFVHYHRGGEHHSNTQAGVVLEQ